MMKVKDNLQRERGLGIKRWKWPTQRKRGGSKVEQVMKLARRKKKKKKEGLKLNDKGDLHK
jgi:hypothetical protein